MALADFISLLAPLLAPNKLILSDQNGTRPAKPYATISVRSILAANAEQSEADVTGEVDIWHHRLNTVEVQFFGDNASDLASNLALKLSYPSTSDSAERLNVGIASINRVIRVPELLNTSQYEERAILEFTAYDLLLGSENVGLIEAVDFESEVEGSYEQAFIVEKPAQSN